MSTEDAETPTPMEKRKGKQNMKKKARPWSVVVIPDKTRPRDFQVRPVFARRRAPWKKDKLAEEEDPGPVLVPIPRDEAAFYQQRRVPEWGVEQTAAPSEPAGTSPSKTTKYAAVDADHGEYGLVLDTGPNQQQGVQSLTLKILRHVHYPWKVLQKIRPGSTLAVHGPSSLRRVLLRVRYTTPARYYPPGTRIASLAVGVDLTDWRCLTADPSRI